MNRPLPPPQPEPDLSRYLLDGRLPNLQAMCEHTMRPIYGLIGRPFGLTLASLTIEYDDQADNVQRATLSYEHDGMVVEVRPDPSDSTSDYYWKTDWSEAFEFAIKHGISRDPSSRETSHPSVIALWDWSELQWFAKCRVGPDRVFLGVVGLSVGALDELIEALVRMDDRREVVSAQQAELWDRILRL